MNIQFAVKDGEIYVLEVNPRASRTVPFVSKATGPEPGPGGGPGDGRARRWRSRGSPREVEPGYVSVKESVFPFAKFPGVDIVLGPEMRSTGEVMGIDTRLRRRVRQEPDGGAAASCPTSGTVFVSVAARDRKAIVPVAAKLAAMGYDLMGTCGHRRRPGRARDRRRRRSARSTRAGRTSSTTWPTARSP